jgi:hypothetical protein
MARSRAGWEKPYAGSKWVFSADVLHGQEPLKALDLEAPERLRAFLCGEFIGGPCGADFHLDIFDCGSGFDNVPTGAAYLGRLDPLPVPVTAYKMKRKEDPLAFLHIPSGFG